MGDHENPERTGVWIGIGIALLGLVLMVLPSLVGMDGMGGGYALQFIGLFVTLSGLVTLWFCQTRASALERILSGVGLLAHWSYDPAEFQRQAREEYEQRRERNRGLFFLVAAMMLVIGAVVFVVPILRDADLFLPVVIVYLSVIALIGLAAFAAPRLEYRRALRSNGDAWIAREGVYLRGAFHNWKAPFSRLEHVRLTKKRGQTVLEFDIGQLSRVGWIHYETETVQVAVPSGQEDRAEEIARSFGR